MPEFLVERYVPRIDAAVLGAIGARLERGGRAPRHGPGGGVAAVRRDPGRGDVLLLLQRAWPRPGGPIPCSIIRRSRTATPRHPFSSRTLTSLRRTGLPNSRQFREQTTRRGYQTGTSARARSGTGGHCRHNPSSPFAGQMCSQVTARARRDRLRTSMVRRGSTVRVRQRGCTKCLQIGISSRLCVQHAGTPRVHQLCSPGTASVSRDVLR